MTLENNICDEKMLASYVDKSAGFITNLNGLVNKIDEFEENYKLIKNQDYELNSFTMGNIQTNKKLYNEYLLIAEKFKNELKFQEAINYYDKLIDLYPLLGHPYYLKGLALNDLKEFLNAIECYIKAIEINSKKFKILLS